MKVSNTYSTLAASSAKSGTCVGPNRCEWISHPIESTSFTTLRSRITSTVLVSKSAILQSTSLSSRPPNTTSHISLGISSISNSLSNSSYHSTTTSQMHMPCGPSTRKPTYSFTNTTSRLPQTNPWSSGFPSRNIPLTTANSKLSTSISVIDTSEISTSSKQQSTRMGSSPSLTKPHTSSQTRHTSSKPTGETTGAEDPVSATTTSAPGTTESDEPETTDIPSTTEDSYQFPSAYSMSDIEIGVSPTTTRDNSATLTSVIVHGTGFNQKPITPSSSDLSMHTTLKTGLKPESTSDQPISSTAQTAAEYSMPPPSYSFGLEIV